MLKPEQIRQVSALQHFWPLSASQYYSNPDVHLIDGQVQDITYLDNAVGFEVGWDPEAIGVVGLPSPLDIGLKSGSLLTFFMAGEPLRGEAVCFRFLSSALVGVADLGTGDLPLSFLDPVMRKALVNSSSLRSGSSDSLSELLELSSDPGKYFVKMFFKKE